MSHANLGTLPEHVHGLTLQEALNLNTLEFIQWQLYIPNEQLYILHQWIAFDIRMDAKMNTIIKGIESGKTFHDLREQYSINKSK